jgi:CRISPR-associated endonuclease Csn1
MNTASKNSPCDIQIAYDVGHDSIGWAVLQAPHGGVPELLGCGAVIFQADDCLASQRRGFRRQRRHIRSTRLRISRLARVLAKTVGERDAALLAELKVYGVDANAEKQPVGHKAPWMLAARVLKGGPLLSWVELWQVLRWYAHNRGYDGNKAWSKQEADVVAQKEDAEKVLKARGLQEKHGSRFMSEVWCAYCGLDPLKDEPNWAGEFRPKGENAAFPREDVEEEVGRILERHVGRLPGLETNLVRAILTDWTAADAAEVKLPARFRGGLLFGQLVPRFDNRIIARCPISYEATYQRVLEETRDQEKAKHEAQKQAKVPAAECVEFYRYRWAMQVANVQIVTGEGRKTRRLRLDERAAVDAAMKERGALTKGEFKKAVRAQTGGAADNLEQMLLHPDAEKALLVDPVQRALTSDAWERFFADLPEPLRERARGHLRRHHSLSLTQLRDWLAKAGETAEFDAELDRQLQAAETKRSKKGAATTREALLASSIRYEPLSGRAPHSREVMRLVDQFVFNSKQENSHPAEEGGPLYRSEAIRDAQLQRALDEQTNNHLVRHRLRLLERLHEDIIKNARFAGGDKERVANITIEVNRELRGLSGKTAKQVAQELGLRLSNFSRVSEKLEEALEGTSVAITAGLIRKARIAEDLGWTCPYTGKLYDIKTLINRGVDKDHVVPRSQRASDSLDSLVITYPSVNKFKGNRTAALFVEQEQGKPVPGEGNLTIKALSRYLKDVESLEAFKGHDDDKRRKKNRKRLLLLRDYVEKEFTPGDLTRTSQLVRLGAETLDRCHMNQAERPVITSIPGRVTAAVRKSWQLLPLLKEGNAQVMEPETGEVRTKTEIRDITHLHHALDACTLAFAQYFLPRNGGAWELLMKRRWNAEEQQQGRSLFGKNVEIAPDGNYRLTDLPEGFKEQIRRCLRERRVVQHVPAEMRGLRAELNAWRVVKTEDGDVHLRQRMRQPDGKRVLKERKEKAAKVVGLREGKLSRLKAALVIGDNYGLALDPQPEILPFHKVWVRLRELKAKNGGKPVQVLRNGMLICLPRGKHPGVWRVFSLKNAGVGILVDLGRPDVVRLRNKTEGHWINVRLDSLVRDGMQIGEVPLTGMVPEA